MKVWVLTQEYNAYDEYGKYFVAVFSEKPHHSQLLLHGVPEHRLRHTLNGGGREDLEENWFYLDEVEAKPCKILKETT